MLIDRTIADISNGLKKKQFSCQELVTQCYDNIEKYEKKINAFITVIDRDVAIKTAREKDRHIDKAKSILYGIPFILKDAYVTAGVKTTCASNVLKDYIPQYDATVYQKLKKAGAILIGKTNMDAWGHGGSSENTDFGPVHNPWNLKRVAGGSSGGSAAAISARMCVFSIGEDTGGSIRNPAAWCNISGLKVTYGRVSRYGSIAYASSFDTVGPMGRSVEDLAYILEIIAGKDPYDATSSPEKVPPYPKLVNKKPKNVIIGWPKEIYDSKGLNKEIRESIRQAGKVFERIGFKIKEISLPIFDYVIPVAYLIALSETSSNLARYDGIRYGGARSNFSAETTRRIMVGTYALSAGYYDAYYRQAQKARTLFIKEYTKAFSRCDVILMPVNPISPAQIGQLISDPLANYLADIYTYSQNPVGIPSLALPSGFTSDNLPIGMQLVGEMFSEPLLLQIGHAYQEATDWHKRRPKILND